MDPSDDSTDNKISELTRVVRVVRVAIEILIINLRYQFYCQTIIPLVTSNLL